MNGARFRAWLSPAGHPLAATAAATVILAVAAAVLILIGVLALDAMYRVPADLGRAYQAYWDSVGQQFHQPHPGRP